MDTKKAIMFLEKLKYPCVEYKDIYYINTKEERKNDNEIFDKIINLLKRGEKLEREVN